MVGPLFQEPLGDSRCQGSCHSQVVTGQLLPATQGLQTFPERHDIGPLGARGVVDRHPTMRGRGSQAQHSVAQCLLGLEPQCLAGQEQRPHELEVDGLVVVGHLGQGATCGQHSDHLVDGLRVFQVVHPGDSVEVCRQAVSQHRGGVVSLAHGGTRQVAHERKESRGLARPGSCLDRADREHRDSRLDPLLDEGSRPPGTEQRCSLRFLEVQNFCQGFLGQLDGTCLAVGIPHPVQGPVRDHGGGLPVAFLVDGSVSDHVATLFGDPPQPSHQRALGGGLGVQVAQDSGAPVVGAVHQVGSGPHRESSTGQDRPGRAGVAEVVGVDQDSVHHLRSVAVVDVALVDPRLGLGVPQPGLHAQVERGQVVGNHDPLLGGTLPGQGPHAVSPGNDPPVALVQQLFQLGVLVRLHLRGPDGVGSLGDLVGVQGVSQKAVGSDHGLVVRVLVQAVLPGVVASHLGQPLVPTSNLGRIGQQGGQGLATGGGGGTAGVAQLLQQVGGDGDRVHGVRGVATTGVGVGGTRQDDIGTFAGLDIHALGDVLGRGPQATDPRGQGVDQVATTVSAARVVDPGGRQIIWELATVAGVHVDHHATVAGASDTRHPA